MASARRDLLFDEREPTIRNMWKVLDPKNTGIIDAAQLPFIRKATGFEFATQDFSKGVDKRGKGSIRHAEFVEMMMSKLPKPEQLPPIIIDKEEDDQLAPTDQNSNS